MERCRSIEHRYIRMPGDEGWGDEDAAPTAPRASVNVLRAIATDDAIRQLPKVQAWSITYAYCYPGLPRGLVLRCMKKWTGSRVTWKVFVEQVEIGRYRVAAILA
jgi:hypothetical protein